MLVGAGNIARCDRPNDEATAAILDTVAGTVFTIGDNVTASGSTTDFTGCYDPTWGRQRARTRPAVGDREYQTAGASGYFAYFGAAAGDPTQGYYSYDLTDWHVIVLNSGSSSVSTSLGSPQEQWLRADLAAHSHQCILAYWHHPRFSSVGTAVNSTVKPLWDDLYAARADIVLNSHYQVYERFAPQTPDGVADPVNGIRQFTVGTGGAGTQGFSTTIRPNSEVRNSGTYGVLKLTLGAGAYSWQFIPVAGQTFSDGGSEACHDHTAVAAVTVDPASASVQVGQTVQLTATPRDAAGNPVSGRTVTWQSSDGGVASVSTSGRVLGLAEGGVTITATSEGQSGSAAITVTALPPGAPVVLVGAGDIADCTSSRDEATAALLDNIAGTVFANGDNAYPDGTAADYTQCYAPSWGRHKTRTRPAPGNHDYNTPGAAGYFGYYGPLAGDPGKGYYAYEIGDWQIISLNSDVDMSAGSAQEQWLRATLAASAKQCTVAYWHHPRFSSGTTHGSLATTQPLWEALYAAGAEIAIAGHEHNYERFAPQTPGQAPDPAHGMREFVVGTGGGSLYNDQGSPLPNSERFNGTTSGVLKLTLGSGTYAWEFIPIAGQTFTDAGSGTCHTAPSTVSASPATIRASTGSTVATISVTARDESGNPLSGATVVLSATGSGNTLRQPLAATDANGVATGTLSSTVAELKTISATINGVAIPATATVAVTPAPASALAFTVQPTSTTGGARIAPAVQVEIRDPLGNRVSSSATVTLAIGTNPAGGTLLGTKSVNAVAGVATFSDLAIDRAGTGYTLRATSGSLAAATSTPFDITGGSVSASLSTVSAAPTTIAAGSGVATITVTVKDAAGNPVSGATVVLAATGSGNTLTQPTGPTGTSGEATGTLSSSVGETKTVSATANGMAITQTATVTVTPPPPPPPGAIAQALLTAGTNPTNQKVYTTAAIGPASNTLITVAVLGHNSTSAPPSPTLSGGGMTTWTEVASVVFDAVATPHRRLTIFRAMSAAPGSGPITITFSVNLSHCQWIVSQWAGVETSGVNGAGAIGQTGSTSGDAVSGLTVPLAAFSNANDVAYGAFAVNRNVAVVNPGAGFTEISEQPSGESTPGDVETEWAANLNTIAAAWTSLNGGALGVQIKAAGGGSGSGVDPAQSTLVAAPASITAGGETATITVTVKDASGAPISGASVVLAATGTGNTLTQPTGLTDVNGVASGTLASTVAGTKTVSATANGTPLSHSAAVTVTAGPVSAARSTVTAAPSAIAPGAETSTITVTAKDGFGNPVSGATVVLAASGSGNTLTQPAGSTNANGVATGTLRSDVEETKTVSAVADGTAITQTATVTVARAISASQSTVTASPTSVAAGEAATITVTVKDASGTPISGASVVLAATGTGNTLTQPTGLTDGNGVVTGTLASTAAGTKTVSATANGTPLNQTAAVTVTAGPVSAAQSTVTAAPATIAAGSGTSTITVTAKDDFGNPVSGATVVLAATGTGNTVTQPAGPSGANGVATGTLSSTVAEPKTVSATASGTAITQTATVTVTAQSSGTITQTLLTAGTNPVNLQVYTTAAIAPAPNTLVTVAVLSHRSFAAAASPTVSGAGMTWTPVASVTFDPVSAPTRRLTLYRAMSGAPGSGPLTITFVGNQSNCQWIVSQWDGVDVSGVNGAGAVVQTGSTSGDGVTGLAVPLGAFGSANSVAYGAFGVNRNLAVITPGAGFTEIAEQPSGEATPGDLEVEWTTNDDTIDATWPLALNGGALAVEIRARTLP